MSELQDGIWKELALLIDIKIRWNSILPMVNRYLEIKTYLKAAFELFNDGELFPHEHDTDLKEIVLVLEPLMTQLSYHAQQKKFEHNGGRGCGRAHHLEAERSQKSSLEKGSWSGSWEIQSAPKSERIVAASCDTQRRVSGLNIEAEVLFQSWYQRHSSENAESTLHTRGRNRLSAPKPNILLWLKNFFTS